MKKKVVVKKKGPGGRPTKYSADILKKTFEYLANCEDEVFTFHRTEGMTSNTFERRVKVNLPSIEGLSIYLNVHRDTIQEWRSKHPEFSVALEKLNALQCQRLIQGGLSGDYNPTIAKLVLSANHGMKERVDQTTDDKPLPANVTVNNYHQLSDDELIKLAGESQGRAGN